MLVLDLASQAQAGAQLEVVLLAALPGAVLAFILIRWIDRK